jgi:uncharacterized phage infection (PIP) family protein YhgE
MKVNVVKKETNIKVKRSKPLVSDDLQPIIESANQTTESIQKLQKNVTEALIQQPHETNELLKDLATALSELPSNIKIDLPETKDNTPELKSINGTLTSLIQAVQAQKQPELKQTEKTLSEVLKMLEKLEQKDTQVLVEQKQVTFPTQPKDAIPVVLVDKDRKGFYDAIQQFFSGGGGGFPSRLTKDDSVKVVNPDGTPISIDLDNIEIEAAPIFDIRNIEEDSTYKYFGFEQRGGTNWRIMRKTLATNTFMYATGTTGYATAWTNRAGESYS